MTDHVTMPDADLRRLGDAAIRAVCVDAVAAGDLHEAAQSLRATGRVDLDAIKTPAVRDWLRALLAAEGRPC